MAAIDAQQSIETKKETTAKNPGELFGFLFALIAAILWGLSIYTFGIPGLYIPALCAVPVLYILLVVISRG